MTAGRCKRCKTQGELLEVYRPAGWEPWARTLRGLFCEPCVKAWAEWDRDPAPQRQVRRQTPARVEALAKANAARLVRNVNGGADPSNAKALKVSGAPTAQRASK